MTTGPRKRYCNSFIYAISECPYSLLGHDLWHKLWAHIIFQERGIFVEHPKEEEFDIQKYGIFVTLPLGKECLLTPTGKELGPNSPTEISEKVPPSMG